MLPIPVHPERTILLMRWFAFACLFAVVPQSLANNVTIVGVNVIDVVSGEMAPDRMVDIVDGRIERIIPSDDFSGQTSSKVVAAEGKYLVAGMSLSWELRRLVEFGMTPLEAIQAATIQPARAFEVEAPAIAAGRVALFIMLNGNPLDDINAFTDPVGVYTGGAWLDRGALMDIEQAARWTDLSLRAGWPV